MIYLIHGTDSVKTREKLHELLDIMMKKKPDASVFHFDTDNWESEKFNELKESQGLFVSKNIVVLDSLLVDKNIFAAIIDDIDVLKNSENVFILRDGTIDAKTFKAIEKKAEKSWLCDTKETKARKEFNVFALTDALGARDRKSLWSLYHKAIFNGSEPEAIHGLLFWQVKNLLIVSKSGSAEEAGVKPFVYSKAKGFVKNFSPTELAKLSSSLIDIYHRTRQGLVDFDTALERFILTV